MTNIPNAVSSPSRRAALWHTIAVRLSAVAGVFSLVVAALLINDFVRRAVKDPSTAEVREGLAASLKQQPKSEAILAAIRQMDLELRREYFRQRTFTLTGASLLCGGIIVFLGAARWAGTLQRKLPVPKAAAGTDWETRWRPAARWAVGGIFAALAFGSVVTIYWPAAAWRGDGGAPGDSVAEGNSAQSPGSGKTATNKSPPAATANAAAAKVITEEQRQKAWPCFRGPGGLGISAHGNVPDAWIVPEGKNVAWKTAVPLPGHNSPVVFGDRVFLSGADATHRQVYCFDAIQGTLLWTREVPSTPASTKPFEVNEDTGFAAPTVATDGRFVAAIFANGDLACFDFDGNLAWSKSLGIPVNPYGHGASLSVYRDRLLVPFDQDAASTKKSALYALDFATGKTVWEQFRNVERGWTTPIVARVGDRDQIITTSNPWIIAYDAANGEELWRARGLNGDVAPSPVYGAGLIFAQADALFALRPDGQGDVTSSHIVWKARDNMPDICSPLVTETHVLVLTSEGTLTAFDLKTGELAWEEDLGDFQTSTSPSLVGKRVYLFGQKGKGWIVEPGPTGCQRVGETDLGEKCTTTPAFQDGCFYIRGEQHLYCIGKPPGLSAALPRD